MSNPMEEGLEPQGYKQVTCSCCGGTRTEIIWGRPYKEPVFHLPKRCECPEEREKK